MAKKYKITKEKLHKLRVGSVRKDKKEAGAYDGRFAEKKEKDKTKYTRKNKHKNDEEDV